MSKKNEKLEKVNELKSPFDDLLAEADKIPDDENRFNAMMGLLLDFDKKNPNWIQKMDKSMGEYCQALINEDNDDE